ncbi:MAG TPA: Asp23/Gls24 family envelope stress response protein [Micromonosporaceae bacterium]|nr:Asp23/Gls24 family envelope stress response protein [Micromonosporaceae bacterium]
MTDVAAGVPAQRLEGEAAPAPGSPSGSADPMLSGEPALSADPTLSASLAGATGTVDTSTATGRAQDAVERVGDRVSDAVDRAGEAAQRAAAASGRVASAVVERLRNNAELAAERGRTTIANEVVEKIAGIAAREVPGVYDLGGDVARVFAAVRERIGLGEADDATDRGISVRLEGGTAGIDITLVIEYGFVVHSVTEKVRAKVISSVENLLGLEVTEVNIVVDDVHVDDSGPVGDDEARAPTYQ